MTQFEIGEQVADKFAAFESEGLHAVASSPTSQDNALAIQHLRVECHRALPVAHHGRERGIFVRHADVERAFQITGQVEWDFDISSGFGGFDIKCLPVDVQDIAVTLELASAMTFSCSCDCLDTLVAIEAQVPDAVIEQGGGLLTGAQ